MKYLRPIYFVFGFFLVALVTFTPERLRGAPRPEYEVRIQFGLFLVMSVASGYYAVRTFLADRNHLKGRTDLRKVLSLTLESDKPVVLRPIVGEGPCQLRLKIKKLSQEPNRDEVEICVVDANGAERGKDRMGFAFDENYEANVSSPGPWSLGIKMRCERSPAEPFRAEVKVRVLGSAQNVTIPDAFSAA